jgi:ATP-binding cassette subfamily B protein
MKSETNSKKGGLNPLFFLFKEVWRYSVGNRKNVVLVWMIFIIAEIFNILVTPQIWAKILDIVQSEGITSGNIRKLLLLLLLTTGMLAFFWLLHGPARVMENMNAFKVRLAYRKHLLRGVMTLPLEWHAGQHSGEIIDKIEKGIQALYQFTKNSFEIIYALVRFFGSFIVLAYLFPPSAAIVLVMMVLTFWIVTRFDKVLIGLYRELNQNENKISASVVDSIGNIVTVIVLRVEKLIFNAIVSKTEKPYELFKKNSRMNEVKWFLSSMCCSATLVIVLGTYFLQHIGVKGGALFGEVFLLYRYLGNISEIFGRFTNLYSDTVQRRASVANAEDLSKDFRDEGFTNHVLPDNWEKLSIEGLRFSYESEGEPRLHLDNVSLQIRHGEKIAVVGESGSGKTTFLKIMRHLYHPTGLKLSLDGMEIQQGFEGVARAITLVPQEAEIFATTVRENITMGADYPNEVIARYVGIAGLTEVIARLPNGLDSMMNEKGVSLSGGEKQRLALARGFLACAGEDKSILLFDEPTSSLDVKIEREVYGKIFDEFKGKTMISSIHKLHLLPLFDRICMFANGQIIASGTFEELTVTCPEFRTLCKQYTQ